ncbi:twin-arginine translocase subunit TatC [Rhizohabitans arisaemae]|uniref:twin-arginine translocase subunit TatC n=1 Tax=Rhizohabitans arisaemae TaxID=2720610 RepID=UPI0024B23734|nr:twin-arginine translocase subunit TatC [Rhizohabitans arisaemae]
MPLLKRSRSATSERKENNDGRMPLMEHLRELRNRLVKAMLGLVAGMILGYIYFDPIWAFVTDPYCEVPAARTLTGECSLTVRAVFQSFFLNLKVAALFAVVASSPWWLYQIWAFVTPGLYRNEKRYTVSFLAIGVPLFFAGTALAYLIMVPSLTIMFGFLPDNVVAAIDIDEYLSFAIVMLLIFGISFELPLLLVFLNVIGVVSHAMVKKHRRAVIFGMFVLGAVATPTGDPFTMLVLAFPMILLFAAAEGFMFLNDRRRSRHSENFEHLDDDAISPLDPTPAPLDDLEVDRR